MSSSASPQRGRLRLLAVAMAGITGLGLAGCVVAPAGRRRPPPQPLPPPPQPLPPPPQPLPPPPQPLPPPPQPLPPPPMPQPMPPREMEDGVVGFEPPPPQGEVRGVSPGRAFFWIGGYWAWSAGRYVWVAGRWERRRPGWHWVAPAWVRHPRGWRFVPGFWQRN